VRGSRLDVSPFDLLILALLYIHLWFFFPFCFYSGQYLLIKIKLIIGPFGVKFLSCSFLLQNQVVELKMYDMPGVAGLLSYLQKVGLMGCVAPPLISPWSVHISSNMELFVFILTFSPIQSSDSLVTNGAPVHPPVGALDETSESDHGWFWYHLSRGHYLLKRLV